MASEGNTKRRRLRIVALIALIALVVIGYFGWRRWRKHSIHGFIVALEPVDANRALLCIRANEEDETLAWLGLWDARKRSYVWSTKIEGPPPVGRHQGLVIVGDVAIVRMDATTEGYALGDGHRLWRTPVESPMVQTFLDFLPADGKAVMGFEKHGDRSVAVLDARSGSFVWRAKTDVVASPQVSGGTLLVEDGFKTVLYALNDGAKREVPAAAGCVHAGDYVYFTGERVDAIALGSKGEPRRFIEALTWPIERPASARAIACGERDGKLVFTIEDGDVSKHPEPLVLVVDPVAHAQLALAKIDVKDIGAFSSIVQMSQNNMFPEHAPLRGALPRYVPVIEELHEPELTFRLAVIDVDERRVVRRGKSSPEMLHDFVQHHGDFFYVVTRVDAGSIAIVRLDGSTGAVSSGARVTTFEEPKPFHLRDGAFWVRSERWKDDVLLTPLDARTLVPMTVGGVEVKALTPEAAAEAVGLPSAR